MRDCKHKNLSIIDPLSYLDFLRDNWHLILLLLSTIKRNVSDGSISKYNANKDGSGKVEIKKIRHTSYSSCWDIHRVHSLTITNVTHTSKRKKSQTKELTLSKLIHVILFFLSLTLQIAQHHYITNGFLFIFQGKKFRANCEHYLKRWRIPVGTVDISLRDYTANQQGYNNQVSKG